MAGRAQPARPPAVSGSGRPPPGAMPPGGFAHAGMTTDTQGVAVPAGPAQHGVWLTYDGGRTWQPSSAGG